LTFPEFTDIFRIWERGFEEAELRTAAQCRYVLS
jgi:hypothetical protein